MPTQEPPRHLVALCTCTPDSAAGLARELLRRKVCACVNVVPGLDSLYFWKGRVAEDKESLLIIKTRSDRLQALEETLNEVHPYDVHELLALPVVAGSQAYLGWLDDCLDGPGDPER